MAQVYRTARNLIIAALEKIRAYAIDDDDIGSAKINQGLNYLNLILDDLSATGWHGGHRSEINFDTTPEKIKYEISNLATADITTDPISTLIAADVSENGYKTQVMKILSEMEFVNGYYTNTTKGRPCVIYLSGSPDRSYVNIYPIPNQTYTITVLVKQILSAVDLDSNLLEVPRYFHKFLVLQLAEDLAPIYNTHLSPSDARQLEKIKRSLAAVNIPDLSLQPSPLLMRPNFRWWW